MADSDDPDVYLMLAINSFLTTPKGKWIDRNALEVKYHIEHDQYGKNMICVLTGLLDDKIVTEYLLRWKE